MDKGKESSRQVGPPCVVYIYVYSSTLIIFVCSTLRGPNKLSGYNVGHVQSRKGSNIVGFIQNHVEKLIYLWPNTSMNFEALVDLICWVPSATPASSVCAALQSGVSRVHDQCTVCVLV